MVDGMPIDEVHSEPRRIFGKKKFTPRRAHPSQHTTLRYEQVEVRRKMRKRANRKLRKRYDKQ